MITLPRGSNTPYDADLACGRATLSAVHRPARSITSAAIGLLLCAPALVGCSRSEAGNAERFCGEIAENKAALTAPELQYSDDVEPLLELYREIGDLAPLAIEEEWNDLVSAYETASTIVTGDAGSEQAAVAAIYSAEASAAKVDAWLRANCAVDIGPVVTLVPHQP